MKNLSTGTGLALLATAIVAYPLVNRISSVDQTAHASVPVAAIAAAATAQANPEPTIVWYGALLGGTNGVLNDKTAIVRAWSDGRIEMTVGEPGSSTGSENALDRWISRSFGTWITISDPAQGYTYRSDINFDERVDGADLAQLLADFGDAPRQDIPPSDCPLNLINP
jgi:hypothetical protein